MSYCRFSSDDFRSDVYVYACAEGWTVHVAANRMDLTGIELPPEIPEDVDHVAEWIERLAEVANITRDAPRVSIDHPAAGEMLIFADPTACADRLDQLEADGFHIPAGVAAAVRAEAA